MDDNDNIIDVSFYFLVLVAISIGPERPIYRFHFSLWTLPIYVFPLFEFLMIIFSFSFSLIIANFSPFSRLQFQKMNFSPFTTQFTGLPANSSLHQFTTAKFAQNLTTSNGQVSFVWIARSLYLRIVYTLYRILPYFFSLRFAFDSTGGQFGVGRRW